MNVPTVVMCLNKRLKEAVSEFSKVVSTVHL